MKYKLHSKEAVDRGFLYRYAVPGGWIYTHTDASSGGWGRAAIAFVPDPSVEVEEQP